MRAVFVLVLLLSAAGAQAQGLMDVLSGSLINPTVGDFAWYEISDATTGQKLFLRQAVVGQEKVKKKEAVWVETEIRPEVGFPTVYKMLLTGPANDPDNIKQLVVQEANGKPEQVEVDESAFAAAPRDEERVLVGRETVPTGDGTIEAEHYTVKRGEETIDLWLNETVRPLGVVMLKSNDGEMRLQRFGNGGEDAQSAMGRKLLPAEPKVDVRVGEGPRTNFSGRKQEKSP